MSIVRENTSAGAMYGMIAPGWCIYKGTEIFCRCCKIDFADCGFLFEYSDGEGDVPYPALVTLATTPLTLPIGACLVVPGALIGSMVGLARKHAK
jgi:hypothetical protein